MSRTNLWLARILPYLLAIGLMLTAFGIRLALVPQLGWREPFALFYLAIFLSAWFGGLAPALLATVLALPLAVNYFIRPLGSLEVTFSGDWAAIGFYLLLAVAICVAVASFRRTRLDLHWQRYWRNRADASLRDQRLLLQTVVDEVPALVGYLDRDWVLRLHNRCFQEWFDSADLDGMRFDTLLAEQFSERDAQALSQALAGKRVDSERDLRHSDGSLRHLRCAFLPHSDADGEILGVVLHMLDETESIQAQKQLIASEHRFRSLVRASTSIVLRVGANEEIIAAQGWTEYTGQPAPENIAGISHDLMPESGTRIRTLWRAAVEAGGLDEIELRLYHAASGEYRHTVLRVVALVDESGDPQEWVGMIRDDHDRRLIELQLQRQERDLRLVLNTTSARISYIHGDGSIRWLNRMAARWSGKGVEDLIGRPIGELLGGDQGDWLSRQIQRAEKGRTEEFEWSFEHPLLGLRWSRSTVTPDIDDNGVVSGYVLLCMDITQRRKMEEDLRRSEAEYRVLTEYVPHMVWISDEHGEPYFFNRRWQEYTGRIPGHPWRQIAHDDDLIHAEQAWLQAVATGNDLVVEMRYRRVSDGSWRWHVVRAVALKNASGTISRWYGTCTEIEDQKRAQRILTQAARKTDEFLGMLSHELRNPLAAISSAAGALALPTLSVQQRQEAGEAVLRQAASMRRMVDDLLDTARVSHGKIELQLKVTDLQALLTQIVNDQRLQIEPGTVELRLKSPTTATMAAIDAVRIQQCIDNLISNAVRASPQGAVIEIGLEPGRTPQELAIVVRDQGHGIDPVLLDAIFEPFVQASTSHGGLGLGLALVRKIVSLHGGEAYAESAGKGQGATFRIYLQRSNQLPENDEPPESPIHRARVLLIDDERDNVQALRLYLEVLGHTVLTAYDGPTGIEIATREAPQVIVCDLGLPPPVSGYDVARRLREAGMSEVYLIAFSGYGRPDDIERSHKAGFDVHVVKPATPQILDREIQNGVASRAGAAPGPADH